LAAFSQGLGLVAQADFHQEGIRLHDFVIEAFFNDLSLKKAYSRSSVLVSLTPCLRAYRRAKFTIGNMASFTLMVFGLSPEDSATILPNSPIGGLYSSAFCAK